MWPLTKSFDFEGHKIAWEQAGEGTPLVLIHGTPFSAFVWRKIAPLLARSFNVYAFDLLGYGQSDKPLAADVSLGVQNTVLEAFLRHTGVDTPNVIAHDFGGATALRAHLLIGVDYHRLLLIDPVAIRPWGSPFVRHVRQHEDAFRGLPDYIQVAILDAYISGAAKTPLPRTVLDAYGGPWRGDIGQPAFYQQIAQMDAVHTDAIEDKIATVRCPVRLLWGKEDQWIPIEDGRRLSTMLPACELIEVDGSGHLMQEDAPEAIIAAALSFFISEVD